MLPSAGVHNAAPILRKKMQSITRSSLRTTTMSTKEKLLSRIPIKINVFRRPRHDIEPPLSDICPNLYINVNR